MDFDRNDRSSTWDGLSYESKNRALYLQQKQTLALFLERGAISQAQPDGEDGDACFLKSDGTITDNNLGPGGMIIPDGELCGRFLRGTERHNHFLAAAKWRHDTGGPHRNHVW